MNKDSITTISKYNPKKLLITSRTHDIGVMFLFKSQ